MFSSGYSTGLAFAEPQPAPPRAALLLQLVPIAVTSIAADVLLRVALADMLEPLVPGPRGDAAEREVFLRDEGPVVLLRLGQPGLIDPILLEDLVVARRQAVGLVGQLAVLV